MSFTNMRGAQRGEHEIRHGEILAESEPEQVWGWATPAGRIRAKRRARLIAEGARLGPGVRAMEIGCGTGMFTEMFAASGARLLAVDISPHLLALAARRALPENQVTFREARFEACEAEGPFDAIIGSSILHHLEVEPALRKIFELLRPGGIASFAEPNMLNPQVFMERKFRFLFPQVSPDETAFVRWSLRRLLLTIGFEDPKIQPFDWLHPLTPPVLIAGVRKLGAGLERIPFVQQFSGSLYIRAVRPAGS